MPWTDSKSFRANNCVAIDGTNGVDINAPGALTRRAEDPLPLGTVTKFQQMPPISPSAARQHALNVILDSAPLSDISLPPTLTPAQPLNGSTGVSEFHLLKDGKTGVLALGSFSENDFVGFEKTLLNGLVGLKGKGATRLVVDVVSFLGDGGDNVFLNAIA